MRTMHAAIVLLGMMASLGADGNVVEIPSAMVKLSDQVDVPASEAGILATLAVREGQMVREGESLAQIVDTEARLAVTKAKIEQEMARKSTENDVKLRYSRKESEVARSEWNRARASVAKLPNSISRSEMDHLQLVSEKADLQIEEAELELQLGTYTRQLRENDYQLAEEKVKRHAITSPLNGVVVQVNRRKGEWVKPGDPVLRILRLDRLRVEGFLKMEHLGAKLPGCRVTLKVQQPAAIDTPFTGKVVFLNPEIDPVNTQVRVWAEVDNVGLRLRPGMRGTLVIELNQAAP